MVNRVCSKCGEELDFWDQQEDFSIHRHLGYGTKFDGSDLDIELCCVCMEELIETCAICPVTEREADEY